MLRFILIVIVFFSGLYFAFTGTRTGQDFLLDQLVSRAVTGAEGEPFDGLRVFVCGSSSPLPGPDRAQSCIAINAGERLYIVDAGAGSAVNLNLGRIDMGHLEAVFLTHFHSDHIAAIGDFNLNSWVAGRRQPLEIFGPVGVDRVVEGLNELYALDRGYRVAHHGAEMLPPQLHILHPRTIEPGVVLDEAGLVVTAFEVDHSPVDPAMGYRFDYSGRSVVVSGDSVKIDSLIEAAQGADLLLHDAISLPIVKALENAARTAGLERQAKILYDIQDYHAPAASLAEIAEATGVRKLAVYHLVPPPQNFLMENIFERDLPADAILTEDRMIFELPAEATSIRVFAP